MHSGELVQLAALVATHAAGLIERRYGVPPSSLQTYWIASKCRLDRWQRSLRQFAADAKTLPTRTRWKSVRPVVEEILLSEMLTRVWTGVLTAYDHHQQHREAEPIARSVLLGQLEARRRALILLMHAPGVLVEDAVALNRLRRKSERWTDLLLANLPAPCDLDDLAIEPQRARDFAADLREDATGGRRWQAWPLMLASLQTAFEAETLTKSPNADLNEQIATSILACFPSELFDSTGLLSSLWMVRLRQATDDAQGMLDELWVMEGSRRGQ